MACRIGFDYVRGYLANGLAALASRPDLISTTERVSPTMFAEEIQAELKAAHPPLILDIRNPREWSSKHIPGSVNIPLNHLQDRLAEIPLDRRIAVHCAGGYRSAIAASILHQRGVNNLIEMTGGLAAWESAKLPLVTEDQPATAVESTTT